MMTWATGAEAARAGQVRVLATAAARRMAALPAVPTLAELGVAGYEAAAWQALVVPAATPDPIAARLTAEVLAICGPGSSIAARIRDAGAEPLAEGPDRVRARLEVERATWAKVIRERGISLE
jgi:tripartite-type tricarboxylate transporter receptor subunit TctC